MALAFANKLLAVYPESIVVKNDIGKIPFEHSITKWIDTELARTGDNVLVSPQLISGLHPFFTAFPQGMFTLLACFIQSTKFCNRCDNITNGNVVHHDTNKYNGYAKR